MLLFNPGSLYSIARPAFAAARHDRPDEHEGAVPEQANPVVEPPRRLALLIVDDELLVARSIARQLRAHAVTVVSSGREALALLAQGQRFDAILCDLMMPEVSGMELHDIVQARHADALPGLLFMTGGGFTLRSQEFLDRAKRPCLRKPFDARQLRAALAALGIEA